MKEYEILFIMKANLPDEKYTAMIEAFKGWITGNEGEIMGIKPWGMRDLPITFQKHDRGYYVECQFKGSNKTLDAIKKNMAVNEDMVRNLIVLLDSLHKAPKKSDANKEDSKKEVPSAA